MITAIVGKPGSGKSLQLVRIAQATLRKGRDVYSNVLMDENKMNLGKKVRGRLYRWKDISEFKYIYNGVILMDEVGAYFDSRSYAKFPEDVRVKFQQYRKDGLDIFYTVQAYSRADLIIRQLTNFVQECHNIFGIFWVTEFYPEEYEKPLGIPRKGRGTFAYFGTKKLYSIYDTKQSINRRDKIPYVFPLMKDILMKGGDMK